MGAAPRGGDFDGWVGQLGVGTRRQRARRHLMAVGAPALPALRRGLRHRDPVVRRYCASILDHLVDQESVPDLVAALDDDDAGVVARALHALACDQCKQNACRPDDELFVPKAFSLLREHPDVHLRAAAVDAIGKAAERRPALAAALVAAGDQDHLPALRNLARRRAARALSARRAETTAP